MSTTPVENDAGPPVARDEHEHELEAEVRAEGRPYVRYRDGVLFHAVSLSPSASPIDVGRVDVCPVRIQSDPLVSRRHARLIYAAGWWSIDDADSHNGTFIGDKRIPGEIVLKDGACFRVGDTVLSLHLPEAGPDQAAPEEHAAPRLLDPDPIQRTILVALARPWLAGHELPVTPSDADIAHALECDVAAIADAVDGLYEQAGLSGEDDQSRRLIALAMHERTVTPDDL
ncbi:MAG TPA: FHA domain-containing protein [Solirubrobacteraceae bacterium]|nr:FHA domain-containing protein [Solirubrobacteraceae bacterium]